MTSNRLRASGLLLAIALGILFQLLCFVRIAADAQVLLPNQAVLRSVFDQPAWHSSLALNVLLFVVAHAALAAAFGILCWTLAIVSLQAWPAAALTRTKWTIAWFTLLATWLIAANSAMFRWSSLGEPYFEMVSARWLGISAFSVVSAAIALAVLITLCRAGQQLASGTAAPIQTKLKTKIVAQLGRAMIITSVVVAVTLLGKAAAAMWGGHPAATLDKPNIILIGIDSLRQDIPLSDQSLTPNVDAFLKDAVRFDDAITPLARTFPSWVSILTGRDPQTTGAYVNLIPRNLIHTGETLPQRLRRAGYTTQYAIDEVRFSNIDTSYGFDRAITPKIGASDFVLGTLNDTPLSNLVANTRLGAWLFPNTHANRAAANTYDPDTFVERIRHEFQFSKGPTFCAVHLTLPHWPYYWATSPSRASDTVPEIRHLYRAAISRADRQFSGVMEIFRRKGLLDNAVVILMSDHGEALGTAADYPYWDDGDNIRGMTALGHGTSALSPYQYRVVLAMRKFGPDNFPNSGRAFDSPVSLIDVAPTVLDLLSLQPADPFDGISLKGWLYDTAQDTAIPNRIRFTQSEFNPRGFQPGKTLSTSALNQIANFYEVDPTTDRISLRPQSLEAVLQDRQYAVLRGAEMMVALPNAERNSFRVLSGARAGGPLKAIDEQTPLPPASTELRAALLQHFEAIARHGVSRGTTVSN